MFCVSERPQPVVQVRRDVTSALELAAQGGSAVTPPSVPLCESHEEPRAARSALRIPLRLIPARG